MCELLKIESFAAARSMKRNRIYKIGQDEKDMFDTGSTLNSGDEERGRSIAANTDLAIALEKFKRAFHEKRIGAGSGLTANTTP